MLKVKGGIGNDKVDRVIFDLIQAIIEMNPHWRPQYYQTFQGSIDYEFVGRYESFSADINYVFDKISTTQLPNLGVEDRHRTNADSLLLSR